jgi:predicted ATP-grasp superfamily ATP-dependent carboligase
VAVIDSDPGSLTLRSRFCQSRHIVACPRQSPEKTVQDLLVLGKRFAEPPMLTYDSDAMLLLVSRHREALSMHYRFLLPDAELVEDMVGKLRFASLAARLDLPVPRSMIVPPGMTAEEIAGQVGLPCILKPDSHVGRFLLQVRKGEEDRPHKVLRADTLEDLRTKYARMARYSDSFVAQQYVGGSDADLYSFHTYFGRDGRPLGSFVGRKIRTYPKDSGFSTYVELVEEPQLLRLGLEIMRRLGHVGPMKLDFKRDPASGRYYLLECNPRFNLWNYLGAACGMNLPRIAVADISGEAVVPVTHYRTGVRWLSLGNDLRSVVRDYQPQGDWSWPGWLWSLRGRKIYDVFSWRDPWPWMKCVGRYLQANWRKVKSRGRPAAVGQDGGSPLLSEQELAR